MKIHRIRLRDYRGIRDCVLEPGETGVTVIEGENEVGKSSVAEALWLIFEQNDDSTSQLVKSLRPADRDAAPEIEIEVSTGPYRFTYFKRFHRGPRTELKILAPKREALAGREADNRARQILAETIDVSLWKALRSQQGLADNLEPLAVGQHRSIMGALETAAGPLMGGDREQSVFLAAQQEYERYFTPSGREKASGDGPNLPRLRQAEADALTELDRLTARIADLEARAVRGAELEGTLARLTEALKDVTARRDQVAEAVRSREEVASAVERLRLELHAREADARSLAHDAEYRTHAAAGIDPLRADLEALRAAESTALPDIERLKNGLDETSRSLEAAAAAHGSARDGLARADDVVQLAARHLQADQMAERLQRLQQLEPEAEALRAWLANCKIDSRSLAELEALDKSVAVLEAQRDAEAAEVQVMAESATSITIGGKEVSLAGGQVRGGRVRGETVMVFPGGITVTIRAGSAARELEARALKAGQDLSARLAAAGVEAVAQARQVLNERAATEERSKQFAARIKDDLRDLHSAQELAEKLQRERAAIGEILAAAGLESVPSVEAAKSAREAAATELAAAEAAHRSASEAHAAASAALAAAVREQETRAARITSSEAEIARAEADLARLREHQDDAALALAIASAAEARGQAEHLLAEAIERLASMPDVSSELSDLSAEMERLSSERAAASREEAGIRALLEDAGAAGLQGLLAEAEQRLTAAGDELASFSRRASAARLLFETLREKRDQARETYAGPLKECIESLGRRVYNDSFGVELSEDLRVVRRTLDGITLDLAHISVGAREQLSVLTRLACAALVSKDGGAPLVLDDILGWADPKRLEALGPVLAQAAGESQVLLFTCTPERFAAVAPATVISMPSGARHERGAPTEGAPVSRTPSALPTPARATPPVRAGQATLELFAEPVAPSPN